MVILSTWSQPQSNWVLLDIMISLYDIIIFDHSSPLYQNHQLKKNTKLYQHRPQIAKTNFCAIKGTTSTPPKLVVTPPAHHSTLQRHPAMAPHPLRQSWSSPSPPTIAHCNGTLQWHPAMAPRPLRQSWPSPSPPPTIAHYNGTLQWHHVQSTIAHYNGTLQLHSPKVGRHPLPQP